MPEHFFKYEFVYIFLFFGFVFLICSAFFKNINIKSVCLLFVSIFFCLSLCELVLYSSQQVRSLNKPQSFISDKPIFLDEIYHRRMICLKDSDNREHMYRFANNIKMENIIKQEKYTIIYDVNCSFFSNGFRYTECNYDSNDIYVFLGCSFTFGVGLNDGETLPYCFSKLKKFKSNVLNFSLPSKGSVSAINILNSNVVEQFVGEKHVKYFIYTLINGHIERNFNVLNYEANDNWIYKNNKWSRVKQPFGIIKVLFGKSYLFKRIFSNKIERHNENFYENYLLENLKEMEKIIKEKYNSKLIIIVWPDIMLNGRFYEKLKNTQFDMIMLPDYIMDGKYRVNNDRHPNLAANEIIAKILKEHINGKMKKLSGI